MISFWTGMVWFVGDVGDRGCVHAGVSGAGRCGSPRAVALHLWWVFWPTRIDETTTLSLLHSPTVATSHRVDCPDGVFGRGLGVLASPTTSLRPIMRVMREVRSVGSLPPTSG